MSQINYTPRKKNVCLSTEIFRTYDKLFESYELLYQTIELLAPRRFVMQ